MAHSADAFEKSHYHFSLLLTFTLSLLSYRPDFTILWTESGLWAICLTLIYNYTLNTYGFFFLIRFSKNVLRLYDPIELCPITSCQFQSSRC